jgi:shikimate dehydrogenase
MHAAALDELRRGDPRFKGWEYFRFDIEPDDLAAALALMRERGFLGVNLTVPHKQLALALAASVDDGAREAGAANTLIAEGAGWKGSNTDGYGLSEGIREDLGLELKGAHVVLLGAGGAARGAAVECLRRGCASLWIANRTPANLEALVAQLARMKSAIPVRSLGGGMRAAGLPEGAIVINATSAGLHVGDPPAADLSRFPGLRAVYDMIYNPPLTPLLSQAARMRIPHANGAGMLAHQGAKSLEIWTGIAASRTAAVMRQAVAKALG